MANEIQIKSYNEILGQLVRKIIADTSVSDLNPGSAILTLLEAVAEVDFSNNVAILNVLEQLNIDLARDGNLDLLASNYGINRKTAIKAIGKITVSDSAITKRSTGLYAVKPAPIKGTTKLYVNNAVGWNASSGTLYIGRGTLNFEGPITWTSIVNSGSFYEIQLSSALQNDHLLSETVIDAQGTIDRIINAGTIIKIPANNQRPEISYTTLRQSVIPSGEDSISDIDIIAITAGTISNTTPNTISQFGSSPFSTASVNNGDPITSGQDIESDAVFRNRIKAYSDTLARGTKDAILSSIIGVSDSDDNKQIYSAVITEPATVEEPSILYIDDGTGFQPSFEGQNIDTLLNNASGNEQYLQLANFPLPRPQVINTTDAPFTLEDGMQLKVIVDSSEELVVFETSDFLNISAAQNYEIAAAINTKASIFKCRLHDNSKRLLLYPAAFDAEKIQVIAAQSVSESLIDANNLFKFPTNVFSYIKLYQNSIPLSEKEFPATILSTSFSNWNVTASGNIILSVDGTPDQNITFTTSGDFGDIAFTSLSLSNWVTAFNARFAGITASATSAGTLKLISNKTGSASSLAIKGGSYQDKIFAGSELSTTGQSSNFKLNRQTGNLVILNDIIAGDTISAGLEDAKGNVLSTQTITGSYNVTNDNLNRPAEIILVADADTKTRSLQLTTSDYIRLTNQGSGVMRIMASTLAAFSNLNPFDYIYMVYRGNNLGTGVEAWVDIKSSGLYQIVAKGDHQTALTDSFVDVINHDMVVGGGAHNYPVLDASDVQAFYTDGFPQLWNGSFVGNPASESITNIVSSLNSKLVNIKASVFKTNFIKLTSTSEISGNIAIPVCVGNATGIWTRTPLAIQNNEPHIATQVANKDALTWFRRTAPTNTNVFLNRYSYGDTRGNITTNTSFGTEGVDSYSEQLASTGVLNTTNVKHDELIVVTRGDNRFLVRSIAAFLASDTVGTQYTNPRTLMDYSTSDNFTIARPLDIMDKDNLVIIMDQDAVNKTIEINLSRTGRVNSGSQLGSFTPTTTQFSANDADNEIGVDFGTALSWSKTNNNSEFEDYALWFRARNYYSTGGIAASNGKFLIRSEAYGPTGENYRFIINYPIIADQANRVNFQNFPTYSEIAYTFGSSAARSTNIVSGSKFKVTSLGSYTWRLDWSDSTTTPNFSTVQINDIISFAASSGASSIWQSTYKIAAVSNINKTMDVYNPFGAITTVGLPEITRLTTVTHVAGVREKTQITAVADVAGSLDGKYFLLYDANGSVAFWFDVDNNGTAIPSGAAGATRAVEITTVNTGDTASTVASKVSASIGADPQFTTSNLVAAVFDVEMNTRKNISDAIDGSGLQASGFSLSVLVQGVDDTLDGKFFKIFDQDGSVGVWFDIDNDGTPAPIGALACLRQIEIVGVTGGMTATQIRDQIITELGADAEFNTAINASDKLDITDVANGTRTDATVETSPFSVSIFQQGTNNGYETISDATQTNIFPLLNTSVTEIVNKCNESSLIRLIAIGSGANIINTATKEESAASIAYNHAIYPAANYNYIGLFDGESHVRTFANTNPNFILKKAMVLVGAAPALYQIDTCANFGIADVGEFFKLIPRTLHNLQHHLTQKALSQMSLVSNIDIASGIRNIQVNSKELGSSGSIEVVGGRGNSANFYIFGDSEINTLSGADYIKTKVSAFPDSLSKDFYIKLQNDNGVPRFSRLLSTDKIDVDKTAAATGKVRYEYQHRPIGIVQATTTLTVTDVSASYGRTGTATVWRWTFAGGTLDLSSVRAGDLVHAYWDTVTALPAGFSAGNFYKMTGDGVVAGFPIIAVNDTTKYVDIVNPNGVAMGSTTISTSIEVRFSPTPIIKWNLKHYSPSKVTAKTGAGPYTVTVNSNSPHRFVSSSSINWTYLNQSGSATVVDIHSPFIFTSATDIPIGASLTLSGKTNTRYSLSKLGFRNLFRLARVDGDSPEFWNCGVAVDDQLVLNSDMFDSTNSGRFQIRAVENDSLIIESASGQDRINTVRRLNNSDLSISWTYNSAVITGAVGSFENLTVGDWVKKQEDDDSVYLQVIAMSPVTPNLATSVTLGSVYRGTTASALSVRFDQLNDVWKGRYLTAIDDIAVYEGDSIIPGDKLQINVLSDANWFSAVNSGTFDIDNYGVFDSSGNYRPYILINNAAASNQVNRLISVDLSGLKVIEGVSNKFTSIKKIEYSVLDDVDSTKRTVYLTPADRIYKWTQTNLTQMRAIGKIDYDSDIIVGIDGYRYYTGLLRRVQRIVDGYEPDSETFPGQKAVGSFIETLPPLNKRITISLNITTKDGINLNDIINDVKATIINYISGLGVGEDVILSNIIVRVMSINGIKAVTFLVPSPNTEAISVGDNEKALITNSDLSIS